MMNLVKVIYTKLAGFFVPKYLYIVKGFKDDLSLQDIDKLSEEGYVININDGVVSGIEFM